MTFLSLQTKVFRMMRDPDQDSFDLDTVKDYINDAERRYCSLTQFAVTKDATISTVSGTQEYSLPTGFHALKGEYIWRGSTSMRKIDQERTISDPNSGSPASYYLRQKSIGLYPTPTSVETITVLYTSIGGTMVDNTDEPIIPEEHQMFLVYYSCMQLCLEDDDVKLGYFRDASKGLIAESIVEMIDRYFPTFPQVGEETRPALDPRYHDAASI